jgi:hypothetical protein
MTRHVKNDELGIEGRADIAVLAVGEKIVMPGPSGVFSRACS